MILVYFASFQTTQKVLNNKNEDRSDVPNTIIIITDQPSSVTNNKLIQNAGKFKAAGGKVSLQIVFTGLNLDLTNYSKLLRPSVR